MAERGRRRPAGSPGGREPRRVERSRDAGRSRDPEHVRGARTGRTPTSSANRARPASSRVVQTPPPVEPKKNVGAIGFATPALWTRFTTKFHGGEGASPRRVVIVITVVVFLGLTLASPLRTFFDMRGEAAAVDAEHTALVEELAKLEARKAQLDDPDYVRAQAGERLGFVPRGSTPYIPELPGSQFAPPQEPAAKHDSEHPWYKNLWDSVSQPLPDENAPPPALPNVIPGPSH